MNVVPVPSLARAGVASAPVVVVGGGPSGVRAAQELSRLGGDVILFNAEQYRPYNRVKLTPLLAGEIQIGQVYQAPEYPGPGTVTRYDGTRIDAIDRAAKTVTTATGRVFSYSSLVLAFGSSAFVPNIEGRDLPGVFSFRDAADVEALLARSIAARSVAIIGGGLLGLEAARGMVKRGADVTVIEHEHRLMPRQLDDAAGTLLAQQIEALGVQVKTGVRVNAIEGTGRVERLSLSTGEDMVCDTVIMCTGVRANLTLARDAGLKVGHGVTVDNAMRSSDPNIFAIGECAEHKNIIYGLVGPGLEQAGVAARVISGKRASYKGSMPTTKLKVIGADVFSMGDVELLEDHALATATVYEDPDQGIYRKVFTVRGRLRAALGVGPWPEASWLQQALLERKLVFPWTLKQFAETGELWDGKDADGAVGMPADAIVCNCTGVTRGRIDEAIRLGANCLEGVKRDTGASTVCGGCSPMIDELLGGGGKPQPVMHWKAILTISALAALVALVTLVWPRIELPDSFSVGKVLQKLWFDNVWKEWSGYTLLGLTVMAAALSLRKRIKVLRNALSYDGWRVVHLIIGGVAALVLFAHTGFRLGENLNMALMGSFLAVLILGAVAGLTTGGDHELRQRRLSSVANPARRVPTWLHILAFWPLPILLAAHVIGVYVF